MVAPEQLSPAPVPSPPPCSLPFGLSWADLGDALPGAAAGGRAVVSHTRRGRHQGGHPAAILTLTYDAPDGHLRQRTLFFKLNADDSREAPAYRFLADRGVPVPQLVVCVEREDEEVLGLAFLPSIGLAPADVDEVLRLVAALNALTDVPEAVATLRPGLPQDEFERLLAAALAEVGAARPDHDAAGWFKTYHQALPLYRDLPSALTHGELAAQQVGRTEDGRLVLLDLATAGRRPRFVDIANVLASLADLSGRTEQSLLGAYLEQLSPAGGTAALDDQAWAELQLTRFVREVEALPWRLSLGEPADLDRHLGTIAADHAAVRGRVAP